MTANLNLHRQHAATRQRADEVVGKDGRQPRRVHLVDRPTLDRTMRLDALRELAQKVGANRDRLEPRAQLRRQQTLHDEPRELQRDLLVPLEPGLALPRPLAQTQDAAAKGRGRTGLQDHMRAALGEQRPVRGAHSGRRARNARRRDAERRTRGHARSPARRRVGSAVGLSPSRLKSDDAYGPHAASE